MVDPVDHAPMPRYEFPPISELCEGMEDQVPTKAKKGAEDDPTTEIVAAVAEAREEERNRVLSLAAACSGDVNRLDSAVLSEIFGHVKWHQLGTVVLVSRTFREALQVDETGVAPKFPSVAKPFQSLSSKSSIAELGVVPSLRKRGR